MTDTVKLKHHEIFLRDRLQLQVLEGFLRYSRESPVALASHALGLENFPLRICMVTA